MVSVCFCGFSGKFSFWEIKILIYFQIEDCLGVW